MSKLSLLEIAQSQLDKTPVIDGQLIVCLDTGNAYRDTATAHVKIGSDLEVVSDLPLAPLAEKIYYLKPDKLYAYLGGNWTLLNDKAIDLDKSIAKLPAGSSTSLNDDVEIIAQDTDITQSHYYRRKLVVLWEYIKTKAQDFFAAKNHKHGKADITDFPTSMPASDVYPWAKAATKPSYTKAEVGLGKVDNTADADKTVKRATTAGTADSANSVTWENVKNKPTAFPVEAHTHDDRYYTEAEVNSKLSDKVDNTEAGANGLINKLSTADGIPNDATVFISQHNDGETASYYRRPISTLWTYIKGKADGVYQPKGSYAVSGHTHDDRYYTESEMNTKLSGKSNTDHTHKNVNDIGTNKPTTFAYSKSGMNYGDYSWLAGWNGYELRAVNKNQFAIADHTHPTSEIYGGNVNYSGYAGPIESAHIDVLRANRLAFLPASGIKVEYSVDGGATWIDYGATDDQKASLFAMRMGSAASFYTGKHTKADECTIKDQLRITVTPVDRYASVNMLYLWVSVAGTSATVNISRSTIGAKETFTDVRTDVPISGWSGPNEIRFSGGTFGGGSTQTSNAYAYRFTFKNKADGKGSVSVMDIRMYGPSAWSVPNNMMEKDHIYNWDANQNVHFPAQVTATRFNGSSTGVVDYGNSNGSTIKIGFGGAGLTKDKLTHIAGYAKDGNQTVIKDVSKGVLQSWLDLGASAYKKVQSLSAVGHSNWTNQSTDDGYVPTMAFMAFWNGAFNGSGNSNLQYCDRGRFGTIVTKNSGDYAAAGHTHDMSMLTGNIINTEPATNNHKIVLGKSGLDKCEFYEYGGIWNFYKMSSGEPNLVASIQSDGIHATLKGTADAANSVDWSKVQNKPSSYPPASHTHAYLPTVGGTMSGQIIKSTGGSWIGDRDRAAIKSGYAGDSSYGAVAAMGTKNGYWTMGNLGGNESLIFNYSTDASYNAGKNETSQVYLPAQAGTIITTATIGSQTVNRAEYLSNESAYMRMHWSGQSGQPSWLWGGNDASNMYVWNPSNFNVNYANSAGAVAWGNVSGKPETFTPAEHTHNYAGSGSAGGSANSAIKLDSSAGSATQPVYFKDGKPVATTYVLNKTVPADAKFTDTNTWRGIQNNLTSDSTDQSLSAAQGKALKTLVDGKAPTSHKHTKSQITDFPSSMPASDVYAWAKAATKPSYTKAEVGLSNVDNTADKDKSVKYAASAGSATTGLNGVSTCIFDLSSNNGSCVRFYNGLQICFGNSSKSSGVVFKLPFANDNYAVVVGGSDTLKNAWYVAGGRTTTGFNPNQSGFAVLFHWIAIGNWK